MKQTAYAILLYMAQLLTSCDKDRIFSADRIPADSETEVEILADGRSEVDFYVYSTAADRQVTHTRTGSGSACLKLPAGDYEIYATANHPRLTEDITVSQIESYVFTLDSQSTALPMSGNAVIRIPADTAAKVHLYPCTAEIVCNIHVADTCPDLALRQIQMCNCAGSGLLFQGGRRGQNLTDSKPVEARETEKHSLSHTFHMAENCAGRNNAISQPAEKSRQNAPEGATYLQIEAERGGCSYIYRVFPGENSTTDFNVRKNTRITLEVTLRSEKEIDARMHSEAISVHSGPVSGTSRTRSLKCLTLPGSQRTAGEDDNIHTAQGAFQPKSPGSNITDQEEPIPSNQQYLGSMAGPIEELAVRFYREKYFLRKDSRDIASVSSISSERIQ